MKTVFSLLLAFLAAGAALLPVFSRSSMSNAMPSPQAPEVLYCASDDGHRKFCPMNTGGGVQLVKQRSGSPCVFDQTWGFDPRGVWVDRGCRADFAFGYTGEGSGVKWNGWGEGYTVYCASDDEHRNRCPVHIRSGVRLIRRRSGAPCIFGESWGYDREGIWVDRGCRADFEIGESGWHPRPEETIYCASDDMHRKVCPANTREDVRIIRQRSEADCIYGRTWGFGPEGIWVDRGCRADFVIGGR